MNSFCNLTPLMYQNFLIKYARLSIPVDIESLQSETSSLIGTNEWLPHLNKKHYTGDWEVLALRSAGGSIKNIAADQMGETDFMDTEIMDRFPSIKRLIEKFNCSVMAVRLLNLRSGAVIKPHRDFHLCFEKGEARIHVPVFTNAGVEFILDDEQLSMKEGECWYINANLMHSVCNAGDKDRIHLVIDCKVNEWLKDIFAQSEKKMIEEQVNVNEIQKIISELRLQNTELSNKLADQLLEKIQP